MSCVNLDKLFILSELQTQVIDIYFLLLLEKVRYHLKFLIKVSECLFLPFCKMCGSIFHVLTSTILSVNLQLDTPTNS